MESSYYVSVLRDDGARAIVCGPYDTHKAALADVFAVESMFDPWRRYAWGTCSAPADVAVRARIRPHEVRR